MPARPTGRSASRRARARAFAVRGVAARKRRRLDAREQLRIAHGMFADMGIEAFASRADQELRATGERARESSVETREDLTAQELQIARLARDGLSNPEIGARLFISPRTVEYHLHKVFTKLGIGSRNELDPSAAARAKRRASAVISEPEQPSQAWRPRDGQFPLSRMRWSSGRTRRRSSGGTRGPARGPCPW